MEKLRDGGEGDMPGPSSKVPNVEAGHIIQAIAKSADLNGKAEWLKDVVSKIRERMKRVPRFGWQKVAKFLTKNFNRK